MPFIKQGGKTISFAEFQDVLDQDQRLFEANEGLTEDVIESTLVRSTERILSLIRDTSWYQNLYLKNTSSPVSNLADIPKLDPDLILDRHADFTELCVQYALWNYILPKIADFSKEEDADRVKISFYQNKYNILFDELVSAGDWYDLDNSGAVTSAEKQQGYNSLKRIR